MGSFNNQNFQALILFIFALIVLNVAFISSNGWARLTWSLFGYLSLYFAYREAQLNLQSIGLSRNTVKRGLLYAAYVIAAIFAVMLAVYFIHDTAYKDPRYNQSLVSALYSALILLPLKTVLFEEIVFRGLLPAIMLNIKNNRRIAFVFSAGAFGLWHILTAKAIGSYSISSGIEVPNVLVVLGVFIATSIAGYLFLELRWRSGSLVAPIAVHWFINGFGMVLASLSWA